MINIYLFYILQFIHICIWLFVIFAFLNKKLAVINLKFIIPFIYLIQILPFHILNKSKCKINENCEKDSENVEKIIGFYYIKKFFDKSFENPFSAQGLLILGAILSYYKISNII